MQGKFKPAAEQKTVPVYFKNVRCEPLDFIRYTILESLQSWAILELDFVGALVLEIVLVENLKERTVATLRMLAIAVVTNFNILVVSISKVLSRAHP